MTRNSEPGTSLRVATTTTLKAPVHQVLEFFAYHQRLGVDEMFLFFDDPTDPAIELLTGRPGLTVTACDDAHWAATNKEAVKPDKVQARQISNANWLIRTLRGRFDWLIHIDSDELIWAPNGLHQTIEREGAQKRASILQLSTLEAIPDPEQTDLFRGTDLFRVHRPRRFGLAKILGARTGFDDSGEFLRGHNQGKPAIALDGVVRKVRIHNAKRVKRARFTRVVSRNLNILHYDAGSFADWLAKGRKRTAFSSQRPGRARRQQWSEFARLDAAGQTDALRELYEHYFLLPPREIPTLKALGLVKRVELDSSWFDWQDPTKRAPGDAPWKT